MQLNVFHKAPTFGTDSPMGSVEIPLESIPPDGRPVDNWYPLKKVGRMKDVAGEVRTQTYPMFNHPARSTLLFVSPVLHRAVQTSKLMVLILVLPCQMRKTIQIMNTWYDS